MMIRACAFLALTTLACNSSVPLPRSDLGSAQDLAVAADLPPNAPMSDLGAASGCVASGGAVETISCCTSTGDFPNLCLIGACSCAPMYSHMIQSCSCPMGKCWNGASCN